MRGKKGPLEIGLFAEMKIYLDSTTVHVDNAKAKTYKKKRSLPRLGSGGRVWSLEQNIRGQREILPSHLEPTFSESLEPDPSKKG